MAGPGAAPARQRRGALPPSDVFHRRAVVGLRSGSLTGRLRRRRRFAWSLLRIMPSPSQLVDHTAWNAAGKLAQFAINLVALALIARIVGPQAYGVIALSWVFIGLTDIFLVASPTETLVQRGTVRDGHLNASFVLPVVVALLAWGALAVGAG